MNDRGKAYWNQHAKNYERSMALLGGPIPRMVMLAAEDVRGAERVLEVAAGTGLVTGALARSALEVISTDYASVMVEQVRARVAGEGLSNVRCEQADLYALPFAAGSFAAVVAANVLHLVPDLPGALAALRSALVPGGMLVVPTYCHDETAAAWLLSRALVLTGFPGQRRFTQQTLLAAVEAAGLTVTRHVLLPGLIPITYLAGRFQ